MNYNWANKIITSNKVSLVHIFLRSFIFSLLALVLEENCYVGIKNDVFVYDLDWIW